MGIEKVRAGTVEGEWSSDGIVCRFGIAKGKKKQLHVKVDADAFAKVRTVRWVCGVAFKVQGSPPSAEFVQSRLR